MSGTVFPDLSPQVTDYLSVITEPMDLSTMARKVREHEYTSLRELVADFDLMIQNCLTYNGPATLFYKAGVKLRDAVSTGYWWRNVMLTRVGQWELRRELDIVRSRDIVLCVNWACARVPAASKWVRVCVCWVTVIVT